MTLLFCVRSIGGDSNEATLVGPEPSASSLKIAALLAKVGLLLKGGMLLPNVQLPGPVC